MIPIPTGSTVQVIAAVSSPSELGSLEPLEWSLPEPSRVFLEVPLASDQDIASIAQGVEAQCVVYNIPTWPECSTHTFIDGDILYIAWMKEMAVISIIGIALMGITLIAPIIMYLVSPALRETMDSLLMMLIMVPMMMLMMKMLPGKEKKPKEPLPPWEERVGAKLDKLTALIGKVEKLIPVSRTATASGIEAATVAAGDVARTVATAKVTSAEKSVGKAKTTAAERKVAKYREKLSEEMKPELDRLQKGIQDLKDEWAEKEVWTQKAQSSVRIQKRLYRVTIAHKDPLIAASMKRHGTPYQIKHKRAYSAREAELLVRRNNPSYYVVRSEEVVK